MGPHQPAPDERAHGDAHWALYLDPSRDEITLTAQAAWYTPDGQLREAQLQLAGDHSEAYDLLNEAFAWTWKRWKRPIAEASGPFG